ncbi:UDP-N-acetylglucosamine 2-epimerase (non-hydrolyzing) [Arthrobacter sp. D5-1]|uniref:non-hydrolyzing UDP-N-acetylglucosamine 2-epimerase n=1 Tax=Arthrobacter sp. D5-1 TaxID=1477518 RepID=UPI001A999DBF|nr:UDP-N-acetylglucosamine 2-epimerase (non-hydrolyzing) [Arthrobacter sp. D5-1]QSZ49898.1 UDP-N-acetyl glucosamine 2-epimerase [Arthrobacter sp. D5-1]
MKVLHVTGARPNFPKMAPVEKALRIRDVDQVLVHTGQHFDRNLSSMFFEQLQIPEPDINLGVGGGSHAEQTSKIMSAIEPVMANETPDLVMVYGDVNSTVAATLVAVKMGLRVAHVEAGLRSNDRSMPEEINRLVVDSIADVLFTTSKDASENLGHEGIPAEKIHFVGNPMIDSLLSHRKSFETPDYVSAIKGPYSLVTLHRPANVDRPEDAYELGRMLSGLAEVLPVVFPVHPRSRESLAAHGILDNPNILVTEPMGYLEFMGTMAGARVVVTDSGGVQEETTVLGVPCLTVRPNTERPVTIWAGTNQLVERSAVVDSVRSELSSPRTILGPPELWDGNAGDRIAAHVVGDGDASR